MRIAAGPAGVADLQIPPARRVAHIRRPPALHHRPRPRPADNIRSIRIRHINRPTRLGHRPGGTAADRDDHIRRVQRAAGDRQVAGAVEADLGFGAEGQRRGAVDVGQIVVAHPGGSGSGQPQIVRCNIAAGLIDRAGEIADVEVVGDIERAAADVGRPAGRGGVLPDHEIAGGHIHIAAGLRVRTRVPMPDLRLPRDHKRPPVDRIRRTSGTDLVSDREGAGRHIACILHDRGESAVAAGIRMAADADLIGDVQRPAGDIEIGRAAVRVDHLEIAGTVEADVDRAARDVHLGVAEIEVEIVVDSQFAAVDVDRAVGGAALGDDQVVGVLVEQAAFEGESARSAAADFRIAAGDSDGGIRNAVADRHSARCVGVVSAGVDRIAGDVQAGVRVQRSGDHVQRAEAASQAADDDRRVGGDRAAVDIERTRALIADGEDRFTGAAVDRQQAAVDVDFAGRPGGVGDEQVVADRDRPVLQVECIVPRAGAADKEGAAVGRRVAGCIVGHLGGQRPRVADAETADRDIARDCRVALIEEDALAVDVADEDVGIADPAGVDAGDLEVGESGAVPVRLVDVQRAVGGPSNRAEVVQPVDVGGARLAPHAQPHRIAVRPVDVDVDRPRAGAPCAVVVRPHVGEGAGAVEVDVLILVERQEAFRFQCGAAGDVDVGSGSQAAGGELGDQRAVADGHIAGEGVGVCSAVDREDPAAALLQRPGAGDRAVEIDSAAAVGADADVAGQRDVAGPGVRAVVAGMQRTVGPAGAVEGEVLARDRVIRAAGSPQTQSAPHPWIDDGAVVVSRVAVLLNRAGLGEIEGVPGALTYDIAEFGELVVYYLLLVYAAGLHESIIAREDAWAPRRGIVRP